MFPADDQELVDGARLPSALETILASHALLHAAEGDLYREALAEAAASSGLAVAGFPPKELYSEAAAQFGVTEAVMRELLARTGKAIGSPWRADHKEAALAALLALGANS
jgi:phosphoserine phosphatase